MPGDEDRDVARELPVWGGHLAAIILTRRGMNKTYAMITSLLAVCAMSLPAYADLQDDLSSFKTSAGQRGLAKDQVDALCAQVQRLTAANDHAVLSSEQRSELAAQILAHTAEPNTVKAGEHNTQLIASLESKLYQQAPEVVAATLADLAIGGSLTTSRGKVISLDKAQLRREAESNGRTFANQLFQVAVANVHWQSQRKDHMGRAIKNGRIVFTQTDNRCSAADTGERLVVAYDDGTVETLIDQNTMRPLSDPAVGVTQLKAAYAALTGRADFDALGQLDARVNPSKFITLGEDTALYGGSGGNGIKIGDGWMVAATNGCANGTCTRPARAVASGANPLRPVSNVTLSASN